DPRDQAAPRLGAHARALRRLLRRTADAVSDRARSGRSGHGAPDAKAAGHAVRGHALTSPRAGAPQTRLGAARTTLEATRTARLRCSTFRSDVVTDAAEVMGPLRLDSQRPCSRV